MKPAESKRQILICGGGPAGLAAAMLFADLGWDKIVLVERRSGPSDFEQNKAFNYQIDPRGQRLLQDLGVADMLARYGVANDHFALTILRPDGTQKQTVLPIVNPLRGTCYWTRRASLQQMLFDAIAARADPRISLLYGHSFTGFADLADGSVAALVEGGQGESLEFTPDLVLGCDGLSSHVRLVLSARKEAPPGHFRMIEYPSGSAGLAYKVLNLPACFPVRTPDGSAGAVDDHRMAYMITSALKARDEVMALAAFPVANASEPRSVNIIREAGHRVWSLGSSEELLVFLEQSFPQLDVRALVSLEQAEAFLSIEPGRFPVPQHAAHVHMALGRKAMHVVLVGDAGHAFPPDLGMGVNSAFEDLEWLGQEIDESPDDLAAACRAYEAERLPQSAALVRLVQTVFPEQYGHMPWRAKLWAAGFMIRKMLNLLLPFAFDKPAFQLVQEHWRSFTEIEQMKRRTDLRLRLLGAAVLAGIFWALMRW